MNFYEVFVRSPVNRQASQMMSCTSNIEHEIPDDDLIFLIGRLLRKRRLLNNVIGIKNNAQRQNLKWKINKGFWTRRGGMNPRAVDEWKRNGEAMQILQRELENRRRRQNEA